MVTDDEQIRTVVADYLDGMVYADETRLRHAFHPDAKSIGHENGLLEWESLDAFIAACKAGNVLPVGEPYYHRIVWIEVTGDIAVVRLEDDYRGVRYTDYLTLMRFDGGWKIINKAFFNHGTGPEAS